MGKRVTVKDGSTLAGIWPIVPTPLTADEDLDVDALRRVIEFEIAAGVDGLWLLGSRGEGPNLSREIHRQVIETAAETARGRVPAIAGCAAPGTRETIENMRRAEDAGADLIQVAEPYYYRMREPWLLKHYEDVIEASRLPLVIYYLEGRQPYVVAGTCPEVVRRFASHPMVVGIKAATSDFALIESMVLATGDLDFGVMVANGKLVYASLMVGCVGAASPEAAFLPKLYVDMYNAVKAGNLTRAWELQEKVFPFSDLLQPFDVPSSKAALLALGLGEEHLSRPFLPMPEPHRQMLIDLVRSDYGPEYTSPAMARG